jgi:capsular polysaccharide biosynthesis protein
MTSVQSKHEPVGPLAAVGRHPLIAVIPVVLFVAAAVVLGVARAPTYTAEARLSVGSPVVSPQAVPGVVAASQALAGTYSRAVADPFVTNRAARQAGVSRSEAADALRASSVPLSSVVLLEAQTTSRADAIKLANAGAEALSAYVKRLGGGTGTSAQALKDYRAASARAASLGRQLKDFGDTNNLSDAERRRYDDVAADRDSAQLKATALGNYYQQLQQGKLNSSPVNLLASADSATSDFLPTLEKLVFSALLIGLVIGIGLALLRANRRRRDV